MVLLFEGVDTSVSEEDKLVSGGVLLVEFKGLNSVIVTEILDELFSSVLLLKVQEHLFTFVSEVCKHLLEKVHGLVLALVSEVTNIFLEVQSGQLVDADINHESDQFLEDNHVLLGLSVLKTNVEDGECLIPVVVKSVQLFSSLEACLWSCPLTKFGSSLLSGDLHIIFYRVFIIDY